MVDLDEVSTTVASSLDRDSSGHTRRERDPLYLFGCHLEWHEEGNVKAYQELVAALDDKNPEIRAIAESLLNRRSPRPDRKLITRK